MQRHDARLEAKRDERQCKDSRAAVRQCWRARRERGEGEVTRLAAPDREERKEGERTRMRRHKVEHPCAPHGRPLVLEDNEQIRCDRHDFPGDQERHDRACRDNYGERGDEQCHERVCPVYCAARRIAGKVRDPVKRARAPHRDNRQQKCTGQRVEAEDPWPTGDASGDPHVWHVEPDERRDGRSGAKEASPTDQQAKECVA